MSLPRINFTLPIPAFSTNNVNSRDLRYKTKEYREWEMRAITAMSTAPIQKELKKLREFFDPAKHSFVVAYTFYYPAFWNKDGNISARTIDMSNGEKLIQDLLFGAKFHPLPTPYGCPNICHDDRNIVSMRSRKKPGPGYATTVQIAIVAKPSPAK